MRKAIYLIPMTAVICAGQSEANPAMAVRSLAKDFIIPRFRAVSATTAEQERAWANFCKRRAPADVDALRRQYNAVSDAWANIEFVNVGPATVHLRVERFNYWLDRRDDGGRALKALLNSNDPKSLTEDAIAQSSVAGQGMPILERLLYGPDAAALTARGAAGERRCAVGHAIARNLSLIAKEIDTDWGAKNGAGPAIIANKEWGVSFTNTAEAASVILTNLVDGLDGLKDFKLAMLLHDAANAHGPRLAENARSGRTLRDIRLNFAALRQGIGVYTLPASPAQKAKLDAAFSKAGAKLDAVARAEKGADRPARITALQAAIAAFADLKQIEMNLLPSAAGVPLGFNNLDGD